MKGRTLSDVLRHPRVHTSWVGGLRQDGWNDERCIWLDLTRFPHGESHRLDNGQHCGSHTHILQDMVHAREGLALREVFREIYWGNYFF